MEIDNLAKSREEIIRDLRPKRFSKAGKIWVAVLSILVLIGLYAYYQQLTKGLSVTAMRDYSPWGIYVSNFVFFVAVSLVGSLISAILKLTNVPWRTPLTRLSEIIAVASILFAGLVIIIDMGRPDRILYVIIYGRIQSPITWDVIVISTYLVISLLLLYLPLLPDFAILKKKIHVISKRTAKLYRVLSLNWVGNKAQYTLLNKMIRVLAILIIPVAFGIHTVTSWLFATTLRPGWDSNNFGPYFISGAFMVGAGAVICAMFIVRRYYKLKDYFTERHFDNMGRLLVLLSLVYLYFNINEYFVPWYKMKGTESAHLNDLMSGSHALLFWSVQVFGMLLPIFVLLFKAGRKPIPLFIVSAFVVVGAWFKRFLIVIPTLAHHNMPLDHVPADWLSYSPTWEEWSITIATLAGALLIITFLVRLVPIVPIAETLEEQGLMVEQNTHS